MITTFSLISTWLIVATACMRYLSTFHPSQNHLNVPYSDSRGCARGFCRGVSARNRGCVVVVLTYVVCVLGNLPSFYLFRATPVSTAGLFRELTTAAAATTGDDSTTSQFVGDGRQLVEYFSPGDDDVWIDFAPAQRQLRNQSDCWSSTNFTHGRPEPTPMLPRPAGQGHHEYVLIDLGPFSHVTRPGYIFHWIKSAMGFFIPGVLLTFFNIRLIQALRRSERLRRSAAGDRSMSCRSSNANPLTVVEAPKTARSAISRNRLNATLVAVIVMLVVLVYPCEFLDFVVHLAPLGRTTAVDEEAMMLTRMILNALQLSNFALNFFLYCSVESTFQMQDPEYDPHHFFECTQFLFVPYWLSTYRISLKSFRNLLGYASYTHKSQENRWFFGFRIRNVIRIIPTTSCSSSLFRIVIQRTSSKSARIAYTLVCFFHPEIGGKSVCFSGSKIRNMIRFAPETSRYGFPVPADAAVARRRPPTSSSTARSTPSFDARSSTGSAGAEAVIGVTSGARRSAPTRLHTPLVPRLETSPSATTPSPGTSRDSTTSEQTSLTLRRRHGSLFEFVRGRSRGYSITRRRRSSSRGPSEPVSVGQRRPKSALVGVRRLPPERFRPTERKHQRDAEVDWADWFARRQPHQQRRTVLATAAAAQRNVSLV